MAQTNVTDSTQEYLEALYALARGGRAATVKEISTRLQIAPPSVTEMLKKLAEKGYVEYSPYHGARLTPEGLKIGAKVSRKHRLLERFLHDVLKIGSDSVHRQACEMEHALSDQAEVALCQFLKHPSKCPDDGKPIEPCDLKFATARSASRGRAKTSPTWAGAAKAWSQSPTSRRMRPGGSPLSVARTRCCAGCWIWASRQTRR